MLLRRYVEQVKKQVDNSQKPKQDANAARKVPHCDHITNLIGGFAVPCLRHHSLILYLVNALDEESYLYRLDMGA